MGISEKQKQEQKERIYLSKRMKCGEVATIIEYTNAKNIVVEFKKYGEKIKCEYIQFKRGTLKSNYAPTVLGVGFLGYGKYKAKIDGKNTIQYRHWFTMLNRCYDNSRLSNYPSYKGCTVCEEWHNFQNFAKWFDENYYEIEGETMCLDKDILYKGNKIYSPSTCVFTPNIINLLFTKSNAIRGNYPIGVHFNSKNKKFVAQCSIYNYQLMRKQKVFLGYFSNEIQAFETYKDYKEQYIIQIANKFKELIPNKLYLALLNYKIEITD